jgi:membrane-associated phospholipid phosphatase
MQFGNGLAIAVVAVVALAWRRFRLAVGLGIAGLSVYLLATVVKGLVNRPRPGALLADVHLRGSHATGNGYPSGHAAVGFALAVIAWLWFGPRLRWFFVAAAVGVAVGRVYVGAHLPLDVVGGAAMGMISGAFVGLLLRVRRHGHEHRQRRRPARASDATGSVAAVADDGGDDPEEQDGGHAQADEAERLHHGSAAGGHATCLARRQ